MLAFELAFKYRNPVVILGDGYLGQMTGKVRLPTPDGKARHPRVGGLRGPLTPGQPHLLDQPVARSSLEQHNMRPEREVRARSTADEQRADLIGARTPTSSSSPATRRRNWPRAPSRSCATGASRWACSAPSPCGPSRSSALLSSARARASDSSSSRRAAASSRTSCVWRSATRTSSTSADEPRAAHGRHPPVSGRDRPARADLEEVR